MTLNKAWVLIGIGTVSLSIVFDVILLSMRANGAILALAMATALSLGGVANHFAIRRYGASGRRRRDGSRRAPSAQS